MEMKDTDMDDMNPFHDPMTDPIQLVIVIIKRITQIALALIRRRKSLMFDV